MKRLVVPPVAPPNIKGRIDPSRRNEPLQIARLLWIREQLALGHTQASVAAALGLTPGSLSRIIALHGLHNTGDSCHPLGGARILAVKVGSFGDAFGAALQAAQHRLLEIAAATEITLVNASMQVAAQKLTAQKV